MAPHVRDERKVIFCDAYPIWNLKNSVQVQPLSKKIFLIQSPSPIKVQNIDKIQPFGKKKLPNSFPLTQSKSDPDPKLMKQFTVRIQSKSNKIRHSPDPVQSKSSPLLISATRLEVV